MISDEHYFKWAQSRCSSYLCLPFLSLAIGYTHSFVYLSLLCSRRIFVWTLSDVKARRRRAGLRHSFYIAESRAHIRVNIVSNKLVLKTTTSILWTFYHTHVSHTLSLVKVVIQNTGTTTPLPRSSTAYGYCDHHPASQRRYILQRPNSRSLVSIMTWLEGYLSPSCFCTFLSLSCRGPLKLLRW